MMTKAIVSVLSLLLITQVVLSLPPYFFGNYFSDLVLDDASPVDRGDLNVDRFLQGLSKRSCIRRGGRCDPRRNDCCSGGACRCNLWGTNCRCQRMGIFQKWG